MLASTRAAQLKRLGCHFIRQQSNIVKFGRFGRVNAGENMKVAIANVPDHDGGV